MNAEVQHMKWEPRNRTTPAAPPPDLSRHGRMLRRPPQETTAADSKHHKLLGELLQPADDGVELPRLDPDRRENTFTPPEGC